MIANERKEKLKEVVDTWRNRRIKAELTQKQLAEKVGVHEFTISRWETKDLNPDVMNIMRVEDVLKNEGQGSDLFKKVMFGKD